MELGILPSIAFDIWALSEMFIIFRTRKNRSSDSKTQDKGSYLLIIAGIFAGIAIAFFFHIIKWGRVGQSAADIGAVLMLAGVILRLWAVLVLGRSFSTVVSVDSVEGLIQKGPYKLIRHPAYTGALLTIVSLGIAMNSWIASLLILLLFLIIYIYRIRIEEKALKDHFNDDYVEYCRNTWRLIPYIW